MYSYDRAPTRTAAKENPLKPLEKELRVTAAKIVGKGMKLADGEVDSSSTSTMASFGIARGEMEKAIQKAIPAKLQKLVTDVEVKIEVQNAMLVVRFYSDEDLEDEAEALMGAVGKGVTFPFNGGESGGFNGGMECAVELDAKSLASRIKSALSSEAKALVDTIKVSWTNEILVKVVFYPK